LNSGLALIYLSRFDGGCSLPSKTENNWRNSQGAEMPEGTESRILPRVIQGTSTNDKLFQLETAFQCASMLEEWQAKISGGDDDIPHEGAPEAAREAFTRLPTALR
jgi:hypothetical protein